MNARFFFLLSTALLFANISYSQHLADNWFFGHNAGLNFALGNPTILTGGQTFTDEGVAVQSDNAGNLLFYTDGVTVWDRNHNIMPNGNGLGGNLSSSQSALILPLNGSSNLYYIFTTSVSFGDFMYSVVDMSLQAGNGDVTVKNSFIQNNSVEKLCAILKPNQVDYWLLIHRGGNDEFNAFSFTSAGINTTPVVSNTGVANTGAIGCMRATPAGDKIATALWDSGNLFELFDFDNSTGMVSNGFTLPFHPAGSGAYGVEFSPSGRYLYTAHITPGETRQYDVTAGSPAAIAASEVLIGTTALGFSGALQLGPDGKIYLAQYGATYMGVINDPEQPGLACNFVDNGVSLGTSTGTLGLPYFPANMIAPAFQVQGFCEGDSTSFSVNMNSTMGGVYWEFGDTVSGPNNTSFLNNPVHLFTDSGTFTVQMIIYYLNGSSDTIVKDVTIYSKPVVSLGNDTTLCNGSVYVLNAGAGYSNYLWQDGSTDSTFTVTQSGTYFVNVSNNSCPGTDTIVVSYISCAVPSVMFQSSDTSFCDKKCIDFTDLSTNSPTSWYWSFPGADSTTSNQQHPTGICYNSYGAFDVTLVACNASGCDTLFMPAFINEYQLPPVPLVSVNGNILTSTPAYSYQWFLVPNVIPGATGQSYTYTQTGTYYVVITDSLGCASSSTPVTITEVDEQMAIHSMLLNQVGKDQWQLTAPFLKGETEIKILDVSGRLVLYFPPERVNGPYSKSINWQDGASGLYFLQVWNGNLKKTFRLSVSR